MASVKWSLESRGAYLMRLLIWRKMANGGSSEDDVEVSAPDAWCKGEDNDVAVKGDTKGGEDDADGETDCIFDEDDIKLEGRAPEG